MKCVGAFFPFLRVTFSYLIFKIMPTVSLWLSIRPSRFFFFLENDHCCLLCFNVMRDFFWWNTQSQICYHPRPRRIVFCYRFHEMQYDEVLLKECRNSHDPCLMPTVRVIMVVALTISLSSKGVKCEYEWVNYFILLLLIQVIFFWIYDFF